MSLKWHRVEDLLGLFKKNDMDMKSFLVKGIVFLLVLVTACKDSDEDNLSKGGSVVGKDFAIKSPNGLLEVNVSTGKKLTFDLNYGGLPCLPSPL